MISTIQYPEVVEEYIAKEMECWPGSANCQRRINRKGVDVFMGATGELCPATALGAYLLRRGGGDGFLFRSKNGAPLQRINS